MDNTILERLIGKLPESPSLLARERYFNSAVLVPFVNIDNEYHMLFQKRAANIRQGSEICFPGGMFDSGKDRNYCDTAVRETTEEMGLHPDTIKVKGQMDTLVASAGVTVDSFLAVLDIKFPDDLVLNEDEVEKTFTLPVSYFREIQPEVYKVRLEVQPSYTNRKGDEVTLFPSKELGLPERYHKPWGGLHHRVLVYKTDEGIIWGITAEIIFDIINKL